MPRLTWGDPGSRYYETGVDHGVLYIGTNPGVPWNGLISVEEEPNGGNAQSFYIDGDKYLHFSGREEFKATVNAYTYPSEFEACDGTIQPLPGLFVTHQKRKSFGFSYRTGIGSDLHGIDKAYRIHLVYNALAEPASRTHSTIGESAEAEELSWSLTTKAPKIGSFRRTAHFIIDSRYAAPEAMVAIETILYGSDVSVSRIPTVQEIFDVFSESATFIVTDFGDGTFEVSGPDYLVSLLDETSFQLSGTTVLFIDDETYSVSST